MKIRHAIYRLSTLMYVWWTRVPEPRAVSVICSIAYFAAAATGLVTILVPPTTLIGFAGEITMFFVGWFLLTGGVLGMVAGALDFWQLERVAITSMAWGLITYEYIIASLHFANPESGSRLTQIGVIVMAMAFLAIRMAMIWRYPFKPRGGDDSH